MVEARAGFWHRTPLRTTVDIPPGVDPRLSSTKKGGPQAPWCARPVRRGWTSCKNKPSCPAVCPGSPTGTTRDSLPTTRPITAPNCRFLTKYFLNQKVPSTHTQLIKCDVTQIHFNTNQFTNSDQWIIRFFLQIFHVTNNFDEFTFLLQIQYRKRPFSELRAEEFSFIFGRFLALFNLFFTSKQSLVWEPHENNSLEEIYRDKNKFTNLRLLCTSVAQSRPPQKNN